VVPRFALVWRDSVRGTCARRGVDRRGRPTAGLARNAPPPSSGRSCVGRYARVMRPVRALLVFNLGVWAGLAMAGRFIKRAVPSRGDEESNELALVAAFDGIELKSRARAFKGGSMLAWFGGIEVDLRGAELAPEARLSVNTLFGGIEIKTPASWRVESSLKALAGGVDAPTPSPDRPDAPVLILEGMALFGGIAVGADEEPQKPAD
jgi:hypothetical protein